jgi:hypothetical protein
VSSRHNAIPRLLAISCCIACSSADERPLRADEREFPDERSIYADERLNTLPFTGSK